MIYYLNSVKKYYYTRVNASEDELMSGSSSDSEEDIGESNRDLKVKKKEFKFSLNNLKTFLAVAPSMSEIEQGIEVLADNGGLEFTLVQKNEALIYQILL